MGDLKNDVLAKLSTVIDPETGIDVIRMSLVESLIVSSSGVAEYQIRPSSMFCPLAVPLSMSIINAVKEVDGVNGQQVKVVGYAKEVELNHMLGEYLNEIYGQDS